MKVICISANNPIFIELQYKTLQKFLKEDYEFIIFNDGKDWPDITNFNDATQGRYAIIQKCIELNIQCINIPNSHHRNNTSASHRHSDSLKYALDYMKNNLDEYLMIDSDMFLVDELNMNDYRKYSCACVLQERPNMKYFWPNFFYINMHKIQHAHLLNLSILPGGDTGSASSVWLKTMMVNNGDDIYFIKHLFSNGWDETQFPANLNKEFLTYLKFDLRNNNNKFFTEIYDNKFLHYRAGTNWMNQSKELHDKNISVLASVIDRIITLK